jgi:hypothetical protein
LVALLGADHEQVCEPTVLAQVALAIIEKVVALLGLVRKVVLGHLAESGETKNGESTWQASDSSATRLDRTLKELTVNVFHVLKESDERVLLGCRRDNTSHCQHVLLASGLELHLIHEILDADLVENTIGIDEQNEQVVVALQVLAVYLVDELEGPLLTVSLATVGETRDGNTAASVGYVDGLGIRIEGQGHAEFLNGIQIELVLLVTVE